MRAKSRNLSLGPTRLGRQATAAPGRVGVQLSGTSDHVGLLTEYVEEHAVSGFRLEDLVRLTGLSRWYICRRFSWEMGITIQDYRDIVRIDAAAMRLARNPDLQVKAVASEAGYRSPSHFCARFGQMVGASPGNFRDNLLSLLSSMKKYSPL